MDIRCFFGKVVSLFAGFGEESVIELFNWVTSDSETITGSGIVKGGVESAIGIGVELESLQVEREEMEEIEEDDNVGGLGLIGSKRKAYG